MKLLTLVVEDRDRGERIDRFIARRGGISRGLARRAPRLRSGQRHVSALLPPPAAHPRSAGAPVWIAVGASG